MENKDFKNARKEMPEIEDLGNLGDVITIACMHGGYKDQEGMDQVHEGMGTFTLENTQVREHVIIYIDRCLPMPWPSPPRTRK